MRYYTALSWGYSLLLLFFFTESPLTPARNRKSLRRTGSDSPTTMLKTINEIPTIDIGGSPLDEQFEHLEEPDPLKSEEGSSSSLRSGESGIDVTDGFFSFGKKQHSNSSSSSSSGRGGLQNGNRSPGMGMEQQMTSTPRDPKSKSKLGFSSQSPSPSKDSDSLTRSAEWMHCELISLASFLASSPGPFPVFSVG